MSDPKTYYILKPEPGGEDLLAIADLLSGKGYSLSYIDREIVCRLGARDLLREHGPSNLLGWGMLTEAVLPDNTPRSVLLDTLRYQLNRCEATTSLLVVDPFLFPSSPDTDYRADLVSLLAPSAKRGLRIEMITKANFNAALQGDVVADLKALNPAVSISFKYTDSFHDRVWISDGARGVFVGTSLNGIGRRYAITDYLTEEDAQAITARCAIVP